MLREKMHGEGEGEEEIKMIKCMRKKGRIKEDYIKFNKIVEDLLLLSFSTL
jgi:hypothetical protein